MLTRFIFAITIIGMLGGCVSSQPHLSILNKINDEVNAIPYVSDQDMYGKADYWASPEEFYANNGGDCEDFAIAKLKRMLEDPYFSHTKPKLLLLKLRNTSNSYHATAYVDGYSLDIPTMIDKIVLISDYRFIERYEIIAFVEVEYAKIKLK
jgi:predicted transglutaminase-like cysteine proteinase